MPEQHSGKGGVRMTEPQQPGNKNLPDFKELDDRVIAERNTSEPILVIKTNLDPKDPSEENPYFKNANDTNSESLKDFFDDENGLDKS